MASIVKPGRGVVKPSGPAKVDEPLNLRQLDERVMVELKDPPANTRHIPPQERKFREKYDL